MGHFPDSTAYPGIEPLAYTNDTKLWDGFVAINPDIDDEQLIDWKLWIK